MAVTAFVFFRVTSVGTKETPLQNESHIEQKVDEPSTQPSNLRQHHSPVDPSKTFRNETESEKSFQRNTNIKPTFEQKPSQLPVKTLEKNLENKLAPPTSKNEESSKDSAKTITPVIPVKDAKGAVHALYRAILWREPDIDGGNAATHYFSHIGWSTYIENAKNMITSPEFESEVAPKYDAISIINRIYSVFLSRCPSRDELAGHLMDIERNEPGQITTAVLQLAQQDHKEKVFKGGYHPQTCKRKNEAN